MFQSGTGLIRFSVSLLLPYLSHHLLCFSFSPFLICKCDSHFLHFPSWISVCCPISVHFPYRYICSLLIHITPLSYSNVHLICPWSKFFTPHDFYPVTYLYIISTSAFPSLPTIPKFSPTDAFLSNSGSLLVLFLPSLRTFPLLPSLIL